MINTEKQSSQRSSLVSQKRKSFQKSIRREQLQSYFAQKRQELTKSFFNKSDRLQLQRPSIELVQQRNQFVRNLYSFFRNQPILRWKQKIEELLSLMKQFQGDFSNWIEYDLNSLLAEVFQQNLSLKDVQVLTAKLFSSQIYHSNPKNCISNAYICDSLIVDNVFILLKTNTYFNYQKICFVTLLAQIAALSNNIRDRIVHIGVGQILTSFADELIQNQNLDEELILVFLDCCQNFCKAFIRNNRFYLPEVSLAREVIAILLKFISKGISTSIVQSSLSCLYTIFKNKDEGLIRKLLQYSPDIFQTFLYLLKNGQIQTKEIVMNLYRLIGLFSWKYIESHLNVTETFDCILVQFERANITRSFIMTAIKTIEMVVKNKKDPTCLLEHGLGKLVIQMLKSHQSDIKKVVYGVVLQITGILQQNPTQLSRFINAYNLLPLIITEISDLVDKSSCILDVLTIIERYIQDHAHQNNDFNQAIYSLQKNFNLMVLLDYLCEINRQGPEFDKIKEKAGKLMDVMVNHYSNDFIWLLLQLHVDSQAPFDFFLLRMDCRDLSAVNPETSTKQVSESVKKQKKKVLQKDVMQRRETKKQMGLVYNSYLKGLDELLDQRRDRREQRSLKINCYGPASIIKDLKCLESAYKPKKKKAIQTQQIIQVSIEQKQPQKSSIEQIPKKLIDHRQQTSWLQSWDLQEQRQKKVDFIFSLLLLIVLLLLVNCPLRQSFYNKYSTMRRLYDV